MQPLPPEEARRDGAEDAQWSRPECQAWTGTLLLGTGLLYCARVSVPVCAVSMSQDFGWNKKEAGVVLSSFFWGYCLTQVVGGHLGDRIGGEKVILLSASAWGFITAATPLLARLSSAHLVLMTFSRILTGLLQGVYFPALTSLLSQKVRESERAFTYSAVGAGSQFGTLVTGAVGSLLLDRYGWPSVFYLSGGLTLLWVCYVHRYLLSEKDLILALGVLVRGLRVSRRTKVPWRQLFRKPSVWAAISAQLSSACALFILLSWLPTFFKETFPSSKGWVFNVVPWLVAIPAGLFSGFLSDHLINQGDGPWPVQRFCPVFGAHLELLQICGVCISFHRPADLQPQWHFRQHPGPGSILCRLSVRCGQHSWGLGRCRRRVLGRLPHRDHGLLDVHVQPGGCHQQPGAVHLSAVWRGPARGPEPYPRGPLAASA
ncbi:solute carrier family 17 member 9 isoform X4 [Prionailurus viverrinus]|uniref:solute carrier family 17 member 9 isoform X4 n=1 Tax=Prionailurus viverrinus TaxID=61388 RepID=UPI001FF33C5E|nr:solute carrier family 17 member 9 isoform X4 [Prionailurus viverrinus]